MEDIPRYSYDLIDQLDGLVEHPQLVANAQVVGSLNPDVMRIVAFKLGQRSIVQMLIDARRDIEEAKSNERTGTDTADEAPVDTDYGLGQVLGPDGEQHQTVASTHVAARLVNKDDDDGGAVPPEG